MKFIRQQAKNFVLFGNIFKYFLIYHIQKNDILLVNSLNYASSINLLA